MAPLLLEAACFMGHVQDIQRGHGLGFRPDSAWARGELTPGGVLSDVVCMLNWRTPLGHQAGYSSVGRASDCRFSQQSDGPWFDSGWPDGETFSAARPGCSLPGSNVKERTTHAQMRRVPLLDRVRRNTALRKPHEQQTKMQHTQTIQGPPHYSRSSRIPEWAYWTLSPRMARCTTAWRSAAHSTHRQ